MDETPSNCTTTRKDRNTFVVSNTAPVPVLTNPIRSMFADTMSRIAVSHNESGRSVSLRVSHLRSSSVYALDGSMRFNETQAVEFARALLGPGYRIERVDPADEGGAEAKS
jgi:hypothetical protein